MINWIEEWYKSQCDGNWEHNYGMKINTIDNPGWFVEVDFNNLQTKIDDISWQLFEVSNINWVGFKVENNIFSASGDPLKLNVIFEIFKRIVEGNALEDLLMLNDNPDGSGQDKPQK